MRIIGRLLPLLSLVMATAAFTLQPPVVQRTNTALYGINEDGYVIRAGENDFALDPNTGGVGLAAESAIKVTGDVKHKPGSANPKPAELLRYTQLQEVSEDQVSSSSSRIVCTGRGQELYKDPGSTPNKEIILAPLDAVRDALNAAGSTQDAEQLVVNFLGGDDLQVLEVLQAIEQLVLNLDVKTSTKIGFNSLCHTSFPMEQASLTLVALNKGGSDEGLNGVAKALADGEVYFQDGKYYTVAKEDISTVLD